MNSLNQLKYSALISYGAIIFSILAGLFYTPWMISQIGRDDFGLYTLVTAFISYFMVDFGLGSVISTYVAKCRASCDEVRLRKVVGICYKAYFIITSLIGIILFVIYFFIDDIFVSLTPEQCARFKVIYCIAGFFSVASFPLMPLNGIIIAYERLVVLKMLDLVQKVLCVVLIVICLLNDWGLYSLVAVNSSVVFLSGLFKLFYVHARIDLTFELRQRLDMRLLRELMSFSTWAFILGIVQRFTIGGAPAILGAKSGASAIAVFSIAMTLEGYVWMFSAAVNGLFIPKVAKYVEAQLTPLQMTDKMIQVGRFQLMATGTLIGGIICLGNAFINLWVGPDFSQSFIIAILIISPQLILVTQIIGTTALWVTNRVKYQCLIYIVGTAISLIISFVLSNYLGALGCGIGVFIGLITICFALNVIFYQKLKFNIGRFFAKCHLRLMPVLALPILVMIILQHKVIISNWYMLLGMGLLYLVMQLVLLFLCLNRYEKSIIIPNYLISNGKRN